MTDKELLELAAKAYGLEVVPRAGNQHYPQDQVLYYNIGKWNPLIDDGDRYRLAKKLRIRIHFGQDYVSYVAGSICGTVRWPEDVPDDAYAVVTAAANIGAAL